MKEIFWYEQEEINRKSYRMLLTKGWREGLTKDKSLVGFCRQQVTALEDLKILFRTYLDESFKTQVSQDQQGKWFPDFFVKWWQNWVKRTEVELERWRLLLKIYQGKTERINYEQQMIRAREVPIPTIIGKEVKTKYGRLFMTCPFHIDKTPSMCWYQKNNKVKCYSCQFNGDPIDVFQKLYSCDFKSAVESLNKF